ncbi:hypothetical protein HOR18_gp162 [Staphylococcus phage vB_SscM-1]|uniref:Uncharacterized protein n=3 Tax=Sciuriunavirus TaxID=2732971 RepID=A0A1X9I9P0_9CAUD|nr:hypothetical protein HOR18_gp162 [Staphylococcus phage vB_SscM-1]ANT44825.1 hypothetical protein vB_SscM-1_161 [Staphylococcus phage vB_SscM-1]ANT45027.1 hypothetical protein vB_SscM-2_160 [Staphylococcus phage vB_SscM-2]QQV88547.1 hypothetical protein [Staphylococcus phage ZCSS1]
MKNRNGRNNIQHQPVNFAPTNLLGGTGNNSFYKKKPGEHKDGAKTIVYKLLFTKRFDYVSQKDIQMQKKYALNLISDSLGIKEEFLTLKQKGKKVEEILHTDRVFYVHRGKKLIGKCSIREQRTFKGTHLIYVFKTRHRTSGKKKGQ